MGTDPAATNQIAENARGYIDLLRAHIGKENNVLFPMADRALTPEDQAHLAQEFERFEAEETGQPPVVPAIRKGDVPTGLN